MKDKLIPLLTPRFRKDPSLYQTLDAFKQGKSFSLFGPGRGSLPLYLRELVQVTQKTLVVILPTEVEAEQFASDLLTLIPETLHIPWWGLLSYHGIAPSPQCAGIRALGLARLAHEVDPPPPVLVLSYFAALCKTPSLERTRQNLFTFCVGEELDTTLVAEKLTYMGYIRAARVNLPGEFALRGEVLDIYPMGEKSGLRLVFEFDIIEKIRFFEPGSQASLDECERYTLAPCQETLLSESELRSLAEEYPALLGESEEFDLSQISQNLPLFYGILASKQESKGASLFDYLDEYALFLTDDRHLDSLSESGLKEVERLCVEASAKGFAVPKVEEAFFDGSLIGLSPTSSESTDNAKDEFKGQKISLHSLRDSQTDFVLNWTPIPSYGGNVNLFRDEIKSLAQDNECYLITNSEAQKERLGYLLKESPIEVVLSFLNAGTHFHESKLFLVHENELFGRKRESSSSLQKSQSEIIDSFVDLAPGDYVVHMSHGIGQFKGIKRMKVGGFEKDYIQILFAKEDSVFLPIEQMNLVQRYISHRGLSDTSRVKLDTIGGSGWQKRKSKTSKAVEELADWLIEIHAKRAEAQGFAFAKDDEFQMEFEASFPYTETVDQIQATEEIKEDMQSPLPMERLLCGDVGFGKTEVAMRACFKAVMGGKQVALLCPTTILCEQHYITFQKRFQRFPVSIRMISRFVQPKEQRVILKEMEEGSIDILIGTHRLFSKEIKFARLGLLVVDEEQRFGVKHKEKLRELKSNIDCLTLSATPIPRTLHMSLTNLRDMSMLKTPPQNRLPVETLVQEFNPEVIKDAIQRETDRGGQVFYLHNRVESLEEIKFFLQELIPTITISVAHGSMDGKELEEVMHRFINGGSHLLLATTIIENGIDISNANTIIIDRADRYGIAQLYQLRGRVGRSGAQGYAYLFYPNRSALSEISQKRLRVISDHTELGSGFKVAMQDLEVRGGGNLLGAEQSGEIVAVGFELYLQMLNDAIEKRKRAGLREKQEVYLELEYSAYIPDSYISDTIEKMEIYKRFSQILESTQLRLMHEELHDRFGPPPSDIQRLSVMAELRILCNHLGVVSVKERKGKAEILYATLEDVNQKKVIEFIQEHPDQIKLAPEERCKITILLPDISLDEKIYFLKETLERLGAS